jgi:mono/diheme cytochrome c family protein
MLLLVHEQAQLEARAEKRTGEAIEIGAALYSLHCRSCHGVTGEGVGQLGPALADNSFFNERLKEVGYQSTLRSYILTTSRHGRLMGTRPFYAGNGKTMVMPPWHQNYGGPLRSDELDSITEFILNWEPTATGKVLLEKLELPKIDTSDPEVIDRGKRVFIASCNTCHTAKGLPAAEVPGPDLTNLATTVSARQEDRVIEDYIRESILNPFAFVVPDYATQSTTHTCGAIMTRTEMTALIAFLLQ